MMKMKKMLFVFNPRSGKEAIKNQLSDILGIFCGAGYLPSVYVTQEPGDAAKIAEEYGKDVELFVCSGGDGTLNSVISGIMRLEKRPEIGYLPAGSTNDFARSLKIPANLTKAAQDVVSGKVLRCRYRKIRGSEVFCVYRSVRRVYRGFVQYAAGCQKCSRTSGVYPGINQGAGKAEVL